MVRVIKGPKGPPKEQPTTERPTEGGRIIEKDIYQAQIKAHEILKSGEQQKKQKIVLGRQEAQRAKEETMLKAANEAFEKAAQEAILIFRRRAERCLQAKPQIKTLATEIVLRILGSQTQMKDAQIDEIVARGVDRLRAERQLKIQFSKKRSIPLPSGQPDIEIEEADDLKEGFVRVVTDIGQTLCSEELAVNALSRPLGEP